MGPSDILFLVYAAVAVCAMAMTRAEARAKGHSNPVHAVAGLLACALWPAVLLYVLLAARWQTA